MIQGSKRVSLALVVMSLVVFSAASIVGAEPLAEALVFLG